MIIGLALDSAPVGLLEADDIEVVLFTHPGTEKTLHKSDLIYGGNEVYFIRIDTSGWPTGILYCQFRTIKDGVNSEWYKRHVGFIQ